MYSDEEIEQLLAGITPGEWQSCYWIQFCPSVHTDLGGDLSVVAGIPPCKFKKGECEGHENQNWSVVRGIETYRESKTDQEFIYSNDAQFIAAAPQIVRQLLEMNRRWKSAVEGLTPQGSEYVNDPEACGAAIRKRCNWPKQIIELRTERDVLLKENKQIRDGLEQEGLTLAELGTLISERDALAKRVAERDAQVAELVRAAREAINSGEEDSCQDFATVQVERMALDALRKALEPYRGVAR